MVWRATLINARTMRVWWKSYRTHPTREEAEEEATLIYKGVKNSEGNLLRMAKEEK